MRKYKLKKKCGQIKKYFVHIQSRTVECNLAQKQTWICNYHINGKGNKRSMKDYKYSTGIIMYTIMFVIVIFMFSLIASFVFVNNL